MLSRRQFVRGGLFLAGSLGLAACARATPAAPAAKPADSKPAES